MEKTPEKPASDELQELVGKTPFNQISAIADWLDKEKGLKLLIINDIATLAGPKDALFDFLKGVFQPPFEGKETSP